MIFTKRLNKLTKNVAVYIEILLLNIVTNIKYYNNTDSFLLHFYVVRNKFLNISKPVINFFTV